MNLKASVARELLEGRPQPVFRRIALNATFREATGLDLRIGYYGLPRGALLAAARQAAQGHDMTVQDRSGTPAYIRLEDGRLVIRTKAADGTEIQIAPSDLQLLSPDPNTRREAFLETIVQFGATGPKPDVWLPLLEIRPLTTDELDTIYGEMRNSLNQWREWITEKIDSQHALISDLTPNEPGYFSSLCGSPPPGDMPPEAWIAGPLAEYRRRLVDADLASGLAAILPGSVRHDLGPAALVADLGDEAVWAVIQALPDFIDPFSLLGLLDIALPRRERHSGFHDMAEALVQTLLADPFQRPDGMDLSKFYPALVVTCLKSLRRTEGLGSAPPSWQRLCAFTHAGHLLEVFGRLDFDVNAMTDGLPLGMTIFDVLTELLDLRSAPMWTSENLSGENIRAEVLSRLSLLRNQELVAGRVFPQDNMVVAAMESAGFSINLPGPLEGHLRPPLHFSDRPCPDEVEQKVTKGLLENPRSESGRILNLAGFFSLGSQLLEKTASVTKSMPLEGESPTEAFGPLMLLALTAAKQGDTNLSDAIARRCIVEVGRLTTENNCMERTDLLFRILLAASAGQPHWSTWLSVEFVKLTSSMPPGPWHTRVNLYLSTMKQLLRPDEWKFGRAAANARLGTLSKRQTP